MSGVSAPLSRMRELVAPGTALVFSFLMLWLAPNYARWFGETLPAFSRGFFALYPLWIAISTATLAIVAVGEETAPARRWPALWRALDALLELATLIMLAGGVIALFLPVLLRPMPA